MVVTLGVSELVLQTAVFIGIGVSMLWYERSLLSPGGVVVPGYVALFLLLRPEVVAYTLAVALAAAVEFALGPFSGLDPGFQVIGFIIPGLIANEIVRQRLVPTLSTLGIVAAITAGATILLVGFW